MASCLALAMAAGCGGDDDDGPRTETGGTGGTTGGTGGTTGGTGGTTGGTGGTTGGTAGATQTGGTAGELPVGGAAGETATGGTAGELPVGGAAGEPAAGGAAGEPTAGGAGGEPAVGGAGGEGGGAAQPTLAEACAARCVVAMEAECQDDEEAACTEECLLMGVLAEDEGCSADYLALAVCESGSEADQWECYGPPLETAYLGFGCEEEAGAFDTCMGIL